MNLNSLKTKCPVCGAKNAPIMFSAEIGGGAKVEANYICSAEIRRFCRPKKQCKTRYKIELTGQAAERVIKEIYSEGGTEYE